MGKTATNISTVLGLITIVFAGYYFYTQKDTTLSEFQTSDQTRQNMLDNTRVFIEYRHVLDSVKMDTSIFADARFQSLRSFSTVIKEAPVGRSDPFAEVLTNFGG